MSFEQSKTLFELAKVKIVAEKYDDALINLKEAGKMIKRVDYYEASVFEIDPSEIKRIEEEIKTSVKEANEAKKKESKNKKSSQAAIYVALYVAAVGIIAYVVMKKTQK